MDGQAIGSAGTGLRARIRALVMHPRFQQAVLLLICLNAVTLGLETSATVMAAAGDLLVTLDRVILAAFVAELALRIYAEGPRFFRGAWNVFDFVVVGIALLPATAALSVLRALRVLRVLRLISLVPRMRRVVEALLHAVPGLGSIIALLLLIFYVFAVMATKLFGSSFPEWFGSIGASMYSLFQIMTLESWSMGIVRPVMEQYPLAWAFFVPFILLSSFTVLNLFIAIIVDSMQSMHEVSETHQSDDAHALKGELGELRAEIAALRAALARQPARAPAGGETGE